MFDARHCHSYYFLLAASLSFAGYLCKNRADMLFSKLTFLKKNQEYHKSVKRFGSRSGLTFCVSRSASKLFVKFISRRKKSPLSRKKLM